MKKKNAPRKTRKNRGKKVYQPPRLVEIDNLKSAQAMLPTVSGPPSATPVSSSPNVPGMVIF